MELSGARVLVAGATGALGGVITAELVARGASAALAGRDPSRQARSAQAYPGGSSVLFDAYDPRSCARAVSHAPAALGGLDAVVVARPVAGTAPPLPTGGDPRQVAVAVADALAAGAELVRSDPAGLPVVERRAR